MPLKRKPTRYAHPEGHTDVCYFTGVKGGLITCGSDGDVRSWLSLLDDDPASCCVSEQATIVIAKNEKLYVGNDNNTIQILTYPELEKDGILTRFSSTVTALATVAKSNLIASGSRDTIVKVTDVKTLKTTDLMGHEAPILGLSLDPLEEFVASSSGDGSIRVWDIKEKQVAHIFNNVVPKCNDFFTSKTYSTPSFHGKDGSYLAYPQGKEIVIVERSSWKEKFRLKYPNLKTELSICKFSECGTRFAASSLSGEIVVWDVESKDVIGYVEHQQNAKITALAWSLNQPNELAFCDMLGQLGCVDVESNDSLDDLISKSAENGVLDADEHKYVEADDDDDDNENVISLSKIKDSVKFEDDDVVSHSDITSEKHHETKTVVPEFNLQPPFQPGASPTHILSRFMVWNDVGIVRCYSSEDNEDSSIEVEFHDATVHHPMHMTNYLHHTIAALSSEALALCCPAIDGTQSKIVVVVLQGWGSGNKEWFLDLPEGEEALCVAAADTFVAVATSRRNLRIFTVGGTQREIIALSGSVVSMNAFQNQLIVAYHAGVGASNDQHMNLLWIKISGVNLRNQTLSVPLSPTSELMWLGLTDAGSPTIMDADGIIKIYDKKSSLWKVACDTNRQNKGLADHYFIIGISEVEKMVRCILCKGSHYPPTTPRPIVGEIPLVVPLCEPESEKSEKEAKLWQIGCNPLDEQQAILFLIAQACRANVEYRAVELCEQIAPQKVIELAIKYAGQKNKMALARKLESIIESKIQQVADADLFEESNTDNIDNHNDAKIEDDTEESVFTPIISPKEPEIRPLSLNTTLRRVNPFLKKENSPSAKGLSGLNTLADKPQKPSTPVTVSTTTKTNKPKNSAKKESFISWFSKRKAEFQEEFPELAVPEITKIALTRYKEKTSEDSKQTTPETKKRKLSSPSSESNNQSKRSTASILNSFAYDK